MPDIKELKEKELKIVSGGVSTNDINTVINDLQQISTIVSNISELHPQKESAINEINNCIYYINLKDYDSAKIHYDELIFIFNNYLVNLLGSNTSIVGDYFSEISFLFNW